jgi:hypothetical protein
MDTPDEHLAAPPLGAFDQLGVPRGVGELLRRPLRKGVGARAEQIHTAVADHLPHRAERSTEVIHRLPGVVTDAGDDLDGVAQQFLVHTRVLAEFGDHLGGVVAQLTGVGVDEGELPLDSDCRPVGAGEIDMGRATPRR